ncbi:MAG: RNA-processing protein [Thermoplasmata archaeon]|mgnify:CR=1 FL=1|nr:MAG: RNA-processing protein [Thermoplasmata archaeon]HDN95544.1 RNA-processing protein [Thermoplasmatales archaeon]
MRYIKIPKERVAVLIGKNGEVKEKIEKYGVKLEIDSATGDVKISGDDSFKEYIAENVVRAIGRGFSPDKALLLFKEDYYFELLDMRDWVGKKPEQVKRIAGRIIGKNGKARRIIEELTGAYISVYGHTVGIIGRIDEVQTARQAIEMLLEGANHSTVYRFLEKERRMKKLQEFGFFERKI